MTKMLVILLALVLLFSIPFQQAYAANITGTVKFAGNGLADAKVTAERAGEYKWTRTATSGSIGSYTLVVDSTNSYSISASKEGFTRDNTAINGGSAAPDLNEAKNPITNIMFKVAFDISVGSGLTIEQARFYLHSAKPWFLEEHSINFQEAGQGTAWSTAGIPSNACETFLLDMKNDVNWVAGNYGIAKVLIGFTGKQFASGPPPENVPVNGCINTIPTSSQQHPHTIVSNYSPDIARTVMHEVSHAFGLQHNTRVTRGLALPLCSPPPSL